MMKTYRKGDRVEITRHAGCEGSTGRVSSIFRCERDTIDGLKRGRTYFNVRMTGGRGAGWTIPFTAKQLVRI